MLRLWAVFERLILTLWVGGMVAIGYIVAPVLFAWLDDRALAGSLAGVLFSVIAWAGILCGILLLIIDRQLRPDIAVINWRSGILITMLALILLGQFIVSPRIAELRGAGLVDSASFAWMHGLASLLFVLTSLLGLILVGAGTGMDRKTSNPGA
jgi:hypothetical protein